MHRGLLASAVSTVSVPRSVWWRVYSQKFNPLDFNGTDQGNARFSPIRDKDRSISPIIYCGSTPKVALMETVLHDVPLPSDGYIHISPTREKEMRNIVGLSNRDPMTLVDLSTLGLRRLGLTRSQAIDSDKTHYRDTRQLAQWLCEARPDVQGIQWTSRQNDNGRAIILFETRLPPGSLEIHAAASNIADERWQVELCELLDVLGCGLISE